VLARSARTRSQLNVLEDLHWADESTLALLVHLSNRIAQIPVVIIGTYRDVSTETNPAFVRTLEELIRLRVRPLKLGGLSKDAVAQMLRGMSQRRAPESLLSAIFEESHGNPFFVEEVFRHLIGSSPERPTTELLGVTANTARTRAPDHAAHTFRVRGRSHSTKRVDSPAHDKAHRLR
jgi:hypothetical protein